jgi:Glycosyl hydrolase family 62
MPVEREDENWIGPLLARHADRRELDLDAFVTRVMTEADASRGGRPSEPTATIAEPGEDRVHRRGATGRQTPRRRRLTPALVAAASALAVVVAASGVSALAHWTTRDDRAAVVGLSPSPGPSPSQRSVPQPDTPPPTVASTTKASPSKTGREGRRLPTSFQWRSGAPVISPRTDATGVTGFKDASVVYDGGRWHVFVTTVSSAGYGLGYLSFRRWSDANSAPVHALASSSIGAGFRAAPQVFYFAPQKLWYLVYQSGNASYSTNPDLNNPNGWSAPKDFYAGVPSLIQKNLVGGFWVDNWVICDVTNCYLFSSDNRGHLFRSQSAKATFPNGMNPPVVAAQDSGQGTTFAASRVYQVAGTGHYLLLSQAFGSDGHGYLRSWTSPSITGPWTSLADTPAKPFAGAADIAFPAGAWTSDIVHGELIRDGVDQSLAVDPCQLRLLYLGLDPRFQDNRSFQIGLLTQTNSTCH